MSQQDILQFQGITGLPEADCRQHLQRTNGNLQTALDAYFNSNVAPPATFTAPPPLAVSTTPLVPLGAHVTPPAPVVQEDFLCGLFHKGRGRTGPSLPLRGLSIKSDVVGFVAQTEVSMRYANNDSVPIEAVFKFKQEECSIYGFEAIIDGEKVIGEVKEKEEALNTYDDAISTGGRGFLLEKDDAIKGAFSLSVGNLPPNKECIVTFRYVSELAVEGDQVRISLPITRLPLDGSSSSSSATSGDDMSVKDGLHVSINVDMPAPVGNIECSSHHHITVNTTSPHTATIQFGSDKHVSSTGLVVLVGQREAVGQPQAIVEVDKAAGTGVAMVSFVPRLDEHLRDSDVIAEVIFVVDRSGSMSGSRMNQAKNALALFLHSLPMGTRFNVVGFGSGYKKLFPVRSAVYDDSTLEQANRYASSMSADMGGTELLAPLRDILSSPADPQFPRQVFVLTDGEVDNTDEVIQCVKKNAKGTRVFTLGIGFDASPQLVNGIASAGKGHAEFVISGERIEAKVLRQLKRALQPVLKVPAIDYASATAAITPKSQTPKTLPAIFEGERVIGYAFFDTADPATIEKVVNEAVLRAKTDVEGFEEVTFKLGASSSTREGQLIHRLAARSLVHELEEANAQANKATITELALRYGLVSAFTSFVAVAAGDEAVEGTMRRVDVGEEAKRARIQKSNLADIQARVDEVKDIMARNIESVLQRGECLESLQDQSQDLATTSLQFSRKASALKKKGGFGGGLLASIGNAFSSLIGGGGDGSAMRSSPTNSMPASDPFQADSLSSSLAMQRSSSLAASSGSDEDDEGWGASEDEKEEMMSEKDAVNALPVSQSKADTCSLFDISSAPSPSVSQPSTTSSTSSSAPAAADDLFGGFAFAPAAAPPRASAAPLAYAAPAPKAMPASHSFFGPSGAAASTAPAYSASMRPLDRLVHHQKASGCWTLNDALAQALQRDLAALTGSVPAGVSSEAWATALALAALEAQFAAEKEEWEMLATKAKRWLAREIKQVEGLSVDALVAQAAAFLA